MFKSEETELPVNLWLCTMEMSKEFRKQIGEPKHKVNLKSAIAMVESQRVGGEHNSSDDAKNTYYLWEKLLKEGIEPMDHTKRFPHDID